MTSSWTRNVLFSIFSTESSETFSPTVEDSFDTHSYCDSDANGLNGSKKENRYERNMNYNDCKSFEFNGNSHENKNDDEDDDDNRAVGRMTSGVTRETTELLFITVSNLSFLFLL